MGSFNTVFAVYSDTGGHWAEKDISWTTEKGFLKGDGNGYFRPEDNVTKAEYVTGVNRLIKSTEKVPAISFVDVEKGAWYYDELAKAIQSGIILDAHDNFNPEKAITRDEAARIIAAAYKLKDFVNGASSFKDYDSIIYKGAVGALVSKKVLSGWDDGKFYPNKNLTRAEYAKILRSSVENMGMPDGSAVPVATKPATQDAQKPEANTVSFSGSMPGLPGADNCCQNELKSLLTVITSANEKIANPSAYTNFSLNNLKTAVRNGETTYKRYVNNSCAGLCPDADMIVSALNNINNAMGKLEATKATSAPNPMPEIPPQVIEVPVNPVPRPDAPKPVERPEERPINPVPRPEIQIPVERPVEKPVRPGEVGSTQRPSTPTTGESYDGRDTFPTPGGGRKPPLTPTPTPAPVEVAPSAGDSYSGRDTFPTPGGGRKPPLTPTPTPAPVEVAPSAGGSVLPPEVENRPTLPNPQKKFVIRIEKATLYVNNVMKSGAEVVVEPGSAVKVVGDRGFGSLPTFDKWETNLDYLIPKTEYNRQTIIFTMPKANVELKAIYRR